jgi:aldehyde dehydrogenase (NAD+)
MGNGTVDVARHEALARDIVPAPHVFVDGAVRTTSSGGSCAHVNPTTGRAQADVLLAGTVEVDEAVAAARRAFAGWRAIRPDERRNLLLRLAALLRDEAEPLGLLTVLECGAAVATASGLPRRGADYLEYFAGYADKLEGRVVPIFPEAAFDYTVPEPYGVVAVISTWNGGISSVCRKAGAALAAGNCVVIKPMELAPFTSLRFAELAARAGFPAGVINVVAGRADAGRHLVQHPDVDKITFTGGAATAARIQADAAVNLTPVIFELGGKSANVVFPDADLEAAGRFAGSVCMTMAGQGCVFPTRLIVHRSIHDEILERATATAGALPIGDPLDAGTVVGPVITEGERTRILGVVADAVERGSGELVIGSADAADDVGPGWFVRPVVFDAVDPASSLARDEIFGPVLSVMTFDDEDEAITLANSTSYGLAGYVHTTSVTRAHRVASRLDAGYISINGFAALPASAPFGGHRRSGHGKEGGHAGLAEFLREKNVYLPMPPA